MRKKYTGEYLKSLGYSGVYKNTWTGHLTYECDWILDTIAACAKEAPDRVDIRRDDIRGQVIVCIPNFKWTPYSSVQCFAVRNMTASELVEADIRLAAQGISVIRSAQ